MHSNVGSKQIDLESGLPQFDAVYLNQEQMSNILSLSRVCENYHVMFDNWEENAFIDNLSEDEFVKFILTPEGLYAYKPGQEFLNSIASFKAETGEDETEAAICNVVTSVDENKKRFTERQFIETKIARDLNGMIGRPTARNFRYLLKPNVIQDYTVGNEMSIKQKRCLAQTWRP